MRRRIAGIAAVITTIVLAIAAIAVVLVVQSQLVANLDRSLEQRADQLEADAIADPTSSLANSNREDRFAQVLDADANVIAATENVRGLPALMAIPVGRQVAGTQSELPIEDDAYRVLIHRFDTDESAVFVIVGENIDDLRDGVRALIVTLSVVFPLAVLALAGAVWWLVGRTLRPVEEIRREVAGIGLAELDRRVPAPQTGDEIDLLAGTMNDMLARLEKASATQRRFVADVSHELRTPLTRMRTTLEVDLSRDDADLDRTARDVLDDAIDMQDLVDDLLFLARRDAGSPVMRRELVDLDVIIDAEVGRARADLPPETSIDMSRVTAVQFVGDDRQLARLARNLLTNAVRHASGRVRVELAETSEAVMFIVDDDGDGVPIADRDRVFERFVRLDAARSARDGGTGLGLAIVRDIARAHGGDVAVEAAPIGGARFVARLPRLSTSAAASVVEHRPER